MRRYPSLSRDVTTTKCDGETEKSAGNSTELKSLVAYRRIWQSHPLDLPN